MSASQREDFGPFKDWRPIERTIARHRRNGKGIHAIAKEVGVGTGTVQRVIASMR